MPKSHWFTAAILAACLAGWAAPASAQMAGGAAFGGMQGMRTFSPVTGAQPMAAGMNMQQMQMAQMYMLYGMMGMGGRGNVSSGVANPFVNGGFGMQGGGNPYFDSPPDTGSSNRHGTRANRDELRAQRAEQQRQAKLAKANAAAIKAAAKVKGKKKPAGVE